MLARAVPLLLAVTAAAQRAEPAPRLTHPVASTRGVADPLAENRWIPFPTRAVPVPRLTSRPDEAVERLLRETLDVGVATPGQVVALGRFGGVADAEQRAAVRRRLTAIAEAAGLDRSVAPDGAVLGSPSPRALLHQAVLLADSLLELGPEPSPEELQDALDDPDLAWRLAALHRIADLPAVATELQAELARLAEAPRARAWTAFDVDLRSTAYRALLATSRDPALRARALRSLLEDGAAEDRVDALRAASLEGTVPQSVLRRIAHRLHAPDDAEVSAALTALAALGLPPRETWRDRQSCFRIVSTSTDAAARELARDELSWRGPWLADVLPRVAALAADERRPALARQARAVHAALVRPRDGAGR